GGVPGRPAPCRHLALAPRRPPRPTPFPYTTLFRSTSAILILAAAAPAADSDASIAPPPPVAVALPPAVPPPPAPYFQVVIEQQRSEEHTSELQSRENLVCRLLLEKKNHAPRPAPPG